MVWETSSPTPPRLSSSSWVHALLPRTCRPPFLRYALWELSLKRFSFLRLDTDAAKGFEEGRDRDAGFICDSRSWQRPCSQTTTRRRRTKKRLINRQTSPTKHKLLQKRAIRMRRIERQRRKGNARFSERRIAGEKRETRGLSVRDRSLLALREGGRKEIARLDGRGSSLRGRIGNQWRSKDAAKFFQRIRRVRTKAFSAPNSQPTFTIKLN